MFRSPGPYGNLFDHPTFFLTPLLLGSAGMLTVWDLLSYKVRDEYVRQSPLFFGMSIWQIKKVLLTSEIRRYGLGETIPKAISAIPQLDHPLPSMALGPGFPGLHHAGAGSAGTTGPRFASALVIPARMPESRARDRDQRIAASAEFRR